MIEAERGECPVVELRLRCSPCSATALNVLASLILAVETHSLECSSSVVSPCAVPPIGVQLTC